METTVINNSLRKKTIEVPDYILRDLAVKAKTEGVSLKKYIESLLRKDAEDIEDSKTYSRLVKEDPEGLVPASTQEQDSFRKWLSL